MMNCKLFKSILGISVLSATGAANAAVVNLTTSLIGLQTLAIGDTGLVPVTSQSGASFTDNFYFRLASTSQISSNVTNVALTGFGFSALSATLYDGMNIVGTGLNFTLPSLAGHDTYDLRVTGTPLTPLGGIFSGAVHVSAPVPIPAAAWLLLSGLAGVGAMARRRKGELAS